MRFFLLIIVGFSLFIHVQGAASLLSDCLSPGNTCNMKLPAESTCCCEPVDDLFMLPVSSEGCAGECLNCNLEAHAADILLLLPSISRKAAVVGSLEATVKMAVAEWSPDPLTLLVNAEIDASTPRRLMTKWSVWRL